MNIDRTEWQTFVLGLYGEDPYYWTFPCLPQVRSGHTRVFPPRATLGPPDPDVDDTLSTLNYMDLSGGQGIARINPSSDLNRTWWSTSDTRGADGWTNPPEAVAERPDTYVGNCVPIGRIGDSMYALWGTDIHQRDPDTGEWGVSLGTIGTVVNTEGIVIWNDTAYFPLGASGYAYVAESASHTLGAITVVAGAATPSSNSPIPTTNPKVWAFAVHEQKLWALTTSAEGYALCSSLTGGTGAWFWPYDTSRAAFVKINKSAEPRVLINWMRPDQGDKALWSICRRGAVLYNPGLTTWQETNLWDVPPHPNFGRCALPFRPGEAIWIAAGGGDVVQYTSSNVAQPGQGPGGRDHGLPAVKRGDVVSMASDLANMYVLMQGDTTQDPTSIVEDTSGSDALYVPSQSAVSSVIAYTGKGWHPLWETSEPAGAPTKIVVADPLKADNTVDYRVFFGVGEDAWSMPCRLTMYSARQGREQGIDRFAPDSYIEFGEFNAGAIANKKWFSHAAVLLDHASAVEYVEYEYQTDEDPSGTWHTLGTANTPNARTVLPFGLSSDGLWSEGMSHYWIKQRLRLVGAGGTTSPTVQALSLAYMPLQQDSAHQVFTIPLPVEVDERSGKTAQQIHERLHELMNHSEQALELVFQNTKYRALIAGMSHTEIAGEFLDGAVGAINLNLIQIPTGLPGLIGESA